MRRLLSERQRRRVPKFLMRWMADAAGESSPDATFLDSVSTYVMKCSARAISAAL